MMRTRRKTIEKNLTNALLEDGAMAMALFEFELEEHVEQYLLSKRQDNDDYLFAVTEHTNDVAMVLIDEQERVLVNEEARTMLEKLWKNAYRNNIQLLIPQMARELDAGLLFSAGVKVTDEAQFHESQKAQRWRGGRRGRS